MKASTPTYALVRPPGDSFARAISSRRLPLDPVLARAEHAEYCAALRAAGLTVLELPPDEHYPDSCFMQDPAVVIGSQAIVGRPGALSRRGEEVAAALALAPHFPLEFIKDPGTLEGGDVMQLPGRVLVGLTARTNSGGVDQLGAILAAQNISVAGVAVDNYLHLLSAAMYLGRNLLLALPDLAGHPAFAGLDVIVVPAEEAYAVNVLALGDRAIVPAGYPRVAELLRARGFDLLAVPTSQFAAADGGVTCLSLLW